MALTAAQIVSLACQVAKAPGMTVQAGQLLNQILSDLCQTYDFQVARKTHNFLLPTTSTVAANGVVIFGGPIALPADFLRCDSDDSKRPYYMLNGVPMPLTPCDLGEFQMMAQMSGNSSYPQMMATDMSPLDTGGAPKAYFWPPSSAALPAFLPYFCQMADIAAPEASSVVPWFPNQSYLQTRLAGELMRLTDDVRADTFLGDGPSGAQGLLTRFLKLVDDRSNRSQSVTLDKRRFGRSSHLKNTKAIGF